MKAIGFKTSLPISDSDSFIAFEAEKPAPLGKDILVKVSAVSVNPVDFKVRQNSAKDKVLDTPKIIGFDAAGIVEAVGPDARLFRPGDAVYYAGDINRPGSNAEYQLVDERIVGRKPVTLTMAEAAAVPLTALTAWELLFHRLRLNETDKGKSVLIIGGAGGVGSMAIQLAKKVAGLQVIATASRPETIAWCRQQGADHVVNHKDLVNELNKAGFQQVDIILDLVDINQYWDAIAGLIKPQGQVASITGSAAPVALTKLKSKSVSFHWESMFTRSTFQTDDISAQHDILDAVTSLLEAGTLQTALRETYRGLTAENFKQVHTRLESGTTIGKIAIDFEEQQ